MKKVLIFLLFFGSAEFLSAQIIADHSVVDSYDDIPEEWLNKVKQMLVWVPGMSHSLGYQNGVRLLALYDSRFASYIWNSDPPPSYSNSYLRLGRPYMSSVNFWTTDIGTYCGEMYKQQIAGNPYTAVINGWSYESTWNNPPGGGVDPVYNIHWAGDVGGLRWGLDAADQSLTGNPVCMDTYISAINTYNAYFSNHGMVTRAIFSTGVVDENAGTENGFQRELKNKHIRDYVNAHSGTILFDYADILVYSNNGERYQAAWNDNGSLRYHDQIHPENKLDYNASWAIVDENDADGDHIGEVGALRLAKALWWMLARIAGWDGGEGSVPVTGITVTGAGGASTITQNKGTLALTATVTPANATNKTVTWSIINGTGQATINSSGVVTAVSNGTVTARATANDGSGVYGQLVITISGQVIPVSGITVTGAGGASTITQDKGTLALSATVTPANATNKTVTWSINNGTGQATINSSGVVTAVSNGTVTARATANDGSGVYGQLVITISGQVIPVSGITVTGAGGASTITQDKGTLALSATVTPANATNKTVTWSINNGTGQATINSSGIVTAVSNGTVTARATANDGSGVYGELVITISGQIIPVSGITVTGAGGASTITQDKGTLALTATVTPANATNKTVTWSIINGTGQATINSSGVVTAVSNGTVTARATANDGSGVYGQLVISISGQVIPVTGITVTGAGGASTITQDKGTLALTATVTPANATNKTVTWSIINGTGQATINSSGVVTAVSNGSVVARATANDGSGVFGDITITISNQVVPVTGISISGGNAISTPGGSLQLSATVTPSNATDKSVAWSITGGTGQATISQNGLVTAVSNGNVIIRATANGGTDIYATTTISVTNQTVLVESITVTASGGSATMTGLETSLQLNAAVSPANATNKNVNWSVVNGSGQATISSTGLLTPVAYGTVTAIASAVDGSGVSGDITINIVRDVINITGISVSGQKGETTINEIGGTLQLTAEVTPADASDKTITWSINNGTGRATISSDGLVTAEAYGFVTAVATANDGSGISGSLQIGIDDSQDKTLLPYINGNLLKVPLKRRFTGKKIALYDIYGRILETGIADSDIHEFEISKYYPGIYLIVLTDDNVLEVHKVVIH